MTLLRSFAWSRRLTVVAGAGALVAAVAAEPAAQQSTSRVIEAGAPGLPSKRIERRGFNLFGSGDIAITGMKNVGQYQGSPTNYGPCAADGYTYTYDCGAVLQGGAWRSKYFEMVHVVGAPRHEFRKIRTIHPPAGGAVIGNGYTFQWNAPLTTFRGEIGPSDNSLGTIFSGVQSTTDATCKNMNAYQAGAIVAGLNLLAGSDCPETWGPTGFDGPRSIPDTAFAALKRTRGAAFDWQYWQIPEAHKDRSGFIGKFSTYGLMTDYSNEILDSYGAVSPRSTAVPTIDGYPLGLDFRFEAFSFSLPSLANAFIYQMTIVNNSANVYGQGIDYDSLYAGLELGFYDPTQAANTYYVPSRSAILSANRNINRPNCGGARAIPSQTPGCGVATSASLGFRFGATGIVVLKSPIGDMRNKLYTRPGPFNDPTNPSADDTITFNHGHKCGYSPCMLGNLDVTPRRSFGLISSTGENVLDGRAATDLTNLDYYYTFRNWDYPARTGKFNSHVPTRWDYNDDGIQDTLFYDTCDQTVNNPRNAAKGEDPFCVSTFSDSMPGGFINSYGNVFGMATAGPFQLGAGDTTSFIYAFVGGSDSASLEAITNNVIDGYLNFWAGPSAPPAPTIISVNVRPATFTSATTGQVVVTAPQVAIVYSDAPEVWVDPFLTKYANDLAASTAPDQVRLRNLNPNLVAQIRARASDNFQTLYVYKSCDNGVTFTSDSDCVGDPARALNGASIGNGWQPYRIIRNSGTGIANLFVDDNVTAGRTYLYSFITQSRGFTTTVLDSAGTPLALVSRTLTVADSLLAPVATSGPNTRSVYVPISLPAGTSPPSFVLDRGGAASTLPVGVTLGSTAQAGNYQALYATRFIVRDTIVRSAGTTRTRVRAQQYYPLARDAAGAVITGGAVASENEFVGPGPIGTSGVTYTPDTVYRSVNQDTLVRLDTITATAFVFSRGTEPLYISTAPSVSETTPTTFLASPIFPGFILNIDQARVGTYVTGSEIGIRPVNDTVPAASFGFGPQFDEGASVRRSTTRAVGTYRFNFADDAYGPNAPFTIDFTNGAATQAAVSQSLAARAVATTGNTSASVLALVQAATTNPAIELVAGKFPFTVENVTFGTGSTTATGRDVILAMIRRSSIGRSNTILLGDLTDTLRVSVPEDTWVPGDQFAILEVMQVDSMIGTSVVINPATSRPFQVLDTIVTFAPAVLSCSQRSSCNPIPLRTASGQPTPGATGYLTYPAGSSIEVTYEAGFAPGSGFALAITQPAPTNNLSAQARRQIRVVPNPYVYQDQYDQITGRVGTSRVYFSNMPASGSVRIYSVSGQFLQELWWTAADLNGTGDLPYNLRTREGTDLASGLYIWVVKARDGNNKEQTARGKFVVIR